MDWVTRRNLNHARATSSPKITTSTQLVLHHCSCSRFAVTQLISSSTMSSIVAGLNGLTSRLAAHADNPAIPYETLVLALSSLTTVFELYVS